MVLTLMTHIQSSANLDYCHTRLFSYLIERRNPPGLRFRDGIAVNYCHHVAQCETKSSIA